MKLKKKILIATLATLITMSQGVTMASAQETESVQVKSSISTKEFQKQLRDFLKHPEDQILTFEEIETNPIYSTLPRNEAVHAFYKEVERFKKENPNLSLDKVVEHFDEVSKNSATPSLYEDVYTEWMKLTVSEKVLVANNPVNAALTYDTQQQAYSLTALHMGKNGLGDKSDAFRHAIWNALMCRYISKTWAWSYATAHEDKTDAELNTYAADGYLESSHRNMDLHNNEKGRDCWSVLTDSVLWTSDADLVNRVKTKLNNGELTWLHN